MRKKIVGVIIGTTLAAGISCFAGVSSFNNSNVKVNAGTSTKLYYAIPDSVVGKYTVKANYNRKGDGSDWASVVMTKNGETFNGYSIYTAEFTDKYDGLGELQFQLLDGSNWVSQETEFSSWKSSSDYNHKMYVYKNSIPLEHSIVSKSYSYEYLKVYEDWGDDIYCYSFEGSNNYLGSWPGVKLYNIDPNARFNGTKIIRAQIPYDTMNNASFIFHNNGGDGTKTSDLKLASNGYCYYSDGWKNDTSLGKAADFFYSFNEARMNVVSSGSVKSFSVCGLNSSEWVNKYNALSLSYDNKNILDNSTIQTYKDGSTDVQENFKISDIMSYLGTLSSYSSGSRHFEVSTSGSTAAIVVSAGLLTMLAGSYLIFRKKKIA